MLGLHHVQQNQVCHTQHRIQGTDEGDICRNRSPCFHLPSHLCLQLSILAWTLSDFLCNLDTGFIYCADCNWSVVPLKRIIRVFSLKFSWGLSLGLHLWWFRLVTGQIVWMHWLSLGFIFRGVCELLWVDGPEGVDALTDVILGLHLDVSVWAGLRWWAGKSGYLRWYFSWASSWYECVSFHEMMSQQVWM